MQRVILLDVVTGQRVAILQLLAAEDEALLVAQRTLLEAVVNIGFDVTDGIGGLYHKSN